MARRTTAKKPSEELAVTAKAVTSYDVARLAGVSQSAVSRCLSTGGSVSAKTRGRIMKAVDELGYQPNAIARMLFTKRSNLIAVIVANLSFNPDLATTLNRYFAERGLTLILFTLDHEEDADQVIDRLWQYRVDGVISASNLSTDHIQSLADRGMPLVFVNRSFENVAVNSVCCDQAEGERWLVDRLFAARHRRFGIVTGPRVSTVGEERVASARSHLESLGAEGVHVVTGDFTYAGGQSAMREFAKAGTLPDAIICANDLTAMGCMDTARFELKLKVPKDVSIVGFDGASASRWDSYDLVTVQQPMRQMVEAAVDMLIARIENTGMSTEKRLFSGQILTGTSARLSKG
jgi:DNA-binding LacI/PurR family transcriptional regulator